jgi:hypothetical protein
MFERRLPHLDWCSWPCWRAIIGIVMIFSATGGATRDSTD